MTRNAILLPLLWAAAASAGDYTVLPVEGSVDGVGVDVWQVIDGEAPARYSGPPLRYVEPASARVVGLAAPGQPSGLVHPPLRIDATAGYEPASALPRVVVPPTFRDTFLTEDVALFLKNATIEEIITAATPFPYQVEFDIPMELRQRRATVAAERPRNAFFADLESEFQIHIRPYHKLGIVMVSMNNP
jgi:hypothetical protein